MHASVSARNSLSLTRQPQPAAINRVVDVIPGQLDAVTLVFRMLDREKE
jgi:hypothetical protein